MENKLYVIIGKNFEGTTWYVGNNEDYENLSDDCVWSDLEEAQNRVDELKQNNPNGHEYSIEEL